MTDIDVIFFDVDGTLVDSRKDIVKAINYTLRKLGLKERPGGQIVSYIGTGVKDLVKKSLGSENADLSDEAFKMFSDYYLAHATDESKLYPHVKETLEHFKTKRKFVLTNRYKRFADITLRGLGISDYFEDIIGGDDENCLKPSRCVLDGFFKKLKINKARAMMIGDMTIDIMTGKNSGIKTCWVTYGLGKAEDVIPIKPDYIVDDIIKLKDIIR